MLEEDAEGDVKEYTYDNGGNVEMTVNTAWQIPV